MDDHQRALEIWHSGHTKERGVILLDEGTHSFELSNGAKFSIYASPWTPKFGDSAFQYATGEDRYNPERVIAEEATSNGEHQIPEFPNVDIVITHGPPKWILDAVPNGSNAGCPHLRRAIQRARPLLHCFGHVHPQWGMQMVQWDQGGDEETDDGYTILPKPFIGKNQTLKQRAAYQNLSSRDGRAGIEHGKATLMVNAAIMDANGEPGHAPWLLDLDLPAR